MGYEEERPFLQCFKCDLGFWDACYTTETTCVPGERCFTGRGKAGAVCFSSFLSNLECHQINLNQILEEGFYWGLPSMFCPSRWAGHQDPGLCKSGGVRNGDHSGIPLQRNSLCHDQTLLQRSLLQLCTQTRVGRPHLLPRGCSSHPAPRWGRGRIAINNFFFVAQTEWKKMFEVMQNGFQPHGEMETAARWNFVLSSTRLQS